MALPTSMLVIGVNVGKIELRLSTFFMTLPKFWQTDDDTADKNRYIWHMTRTARYVAMCAFAVAIAAKRLEWANWVVGLSYFIICCCWIWFRIIACSAEYRPDKWEDF